MVRFASVVASCWVLIGCSKDGGARGAEPPPTAPAAVAPAAAPAPALPPAPTPAADTAQGAPSNKVEGPGFVVEVQPPEGAKAGQESVIKVVLRATGEHHVNEDFPTVLEVKPPADVAVAKPKQTKPDAVAFEHLKVVFDVKATPSAAGDKKFEATFRFAVCTATTCDPKKVTLAWNVAVK